MIPGSAFHVTATHAPNETSEVGGSGNGVSLLDKQRCPEPTIILMREVSENEM